MLYFCSDRPGGFGGQWYGDIYQAPIIPIVDLNGDGHVDGDDILVLVEHWGGDNSLCDIGPMPWGDGIVDLQDLVALAKYIGQEVIDPTLITHWGFDETEGFVAHDSAGDNEATIVGLPTWRPVGGVVDGALELDGTTFVTAARVLNPGEGPFSVFAWVRGGAAGQAVISQQSGVNWLALDPVTGTLMTELMSGGRHSTPLYSDGVITDATWHRVGLTWDGSNRSLYVDDVLVAVVADEGLAPCSGGLNIGCGKLMTPATFFTGLIDDVRIYSRVVKP